MPETRHYDPASDAGAENWALFASLIQTCKLNGVEPHAWLVDVLEKIVSGRTKINDLHTLLPWAWKTVGADKAASQP